MATNNDNGGHNVESHSLSKFNSDVESHRLSKFNSEGKLLKTVGGEGGRTGQFDCPYGIALSKGDKLFVCDSGNHRIQVFDTNLKLISCFGR